MTGRHCRIGRVRLRGGADLTILNYPAKPYRTTIELSSGTVIVENEDEKPLDMATILFLLEQARLVIWNE